jgi:hypothetical protein
LGVGKDIYYAGDWDGDGKTNIAVRRGNLFDFDYNFDDKADGIQLFGNGYSEDEYLVGDWDGDGRTNVAIRRGNQIFEDFNFDGVADRVINFGNGNQSINGVVDKYLVGDWDGKGKDEIAVRRGNQIIMADENGNEIRRLNFGNGNAEDEYLVGDWDGNGKDEFAVRKGNRIIMGDVNGHEIRRMNYGNGNAEDKYLVGDWDGRKINGNKVDDIAVVKGNRIIMDTNFSGVTFTQYYGNGYYPDKPHSSWWGGFVDWWYNIIQGWANQPSPYAGLKPVGIAQQQICVDSNGKQYFYNPNTQICCSCSVPGSSTNPVYPKQTNNSEATECYALHNCPIK